MNTDPQFLLNSIKEIARTHAADDLAGLEAEVMALIPVGTEFYRVKGTELKIYIYLGHSLPCKKLEVELQVILLEKGSGKPPHLDDMFVRRLLMGDTTPDDALYLTSKAAYHAAHGQRTQDLELLANHLARGDYETIAKDVADRKRNAEDISAYVYKVVPLGCPIVLHNADSTRVVRTLNDLGLECIYAVNSFMDRSIQITSLLPFKDGLPEGITLESRATLSYADYCR